MRITGDPGPLDLAEVAYRAYGGFADWTNHAGNPMPSWRELPPPQRNAWVAAAEAVQQVLVEGRAPSWGAGPGSAYEASHPNGPGPEPVCKCPPGCGCHTGTGSPA